MHPSDMHPGVRAWFDGRTFFDLTSSAESVSALKSGAGTTIGVCLPALNEGATIGPICERIAGDLMERTGLVDRLVVVDSGSTDGTRARAETAGASVYAADEILAGCPSATGKGDALWKSLAVLDTDLVVYLDSDVRNFDPSFVVRLVEPLLREPDIGFVKAFYERPLEDDLGVGGGRVTELVARPLLNLFYPELTGLIQPLAGEYAARTSLLRRLPFATGYGVEIGLLIDIYERFGVDVLAQVDLGERVHRNRPTVDLGPMAFEIMKTVLIRLEDGGRAKFLERFPDLFAQFTQMSSRAIARAHEVPVQERPPMDSYQASLGGTTDGASPATADE